MDEDEHIFDIYTKAYDFLGHDVKVKSAQDLWDFYEANHKGSVRRKIDIYTIAEYFVEQHSNGHYVVDECPLKNDPIDINKVFTLIDSIELIDINTILSHNEFY